jgi:hypothetical protein
MAAVSTSGFVQSKKDDMNLVAVKEVYTADTMHRRVLHTFVCLTMLYELQSLFRVGSYSVNWKRLASKSFEPISR